MGRKPGFDSTRLIPCPVSAGEDFIARIRDIEQVCSVARPALGRSLEKLIRQGAAEGAAPPGEGNPFTDPGNAGRGSSGLQSLLQGGKQASSPASASSPAKPVGDPADGFLLSLLAPSLLLGDAGLMAVTGLFVLSQSEPLAGWEILACILSTAFAAWLGCLAFLLPPKSKRPTEESDGGVKSRSMTCEQDAQ